MKLTYITHFFYLYSTSPDEICVMNTLSELADLNVETRLIIPNFGKRIPKNEYPKIFKYYSVRQNFSLILIPAKIFYHLGFVGRMIYKVISFLQGIRQKSDIYIVRHLELALLFGIFNKPVIFSHHQLVDLISSRFFSFWVRLINNPNKKISMLTITDKGKQKLISLGIDESRILVARMGVNLRNFIVETPPNLIKDQFAFDPRSKVICYSGNMYPGYGVRTLIESAVQDPTNNYVFIGGDEINLARCKRHADHLNAKNVYFLGFIHPADVPMYLKSADILVMPYSTSTPTFEYMSPLKMFDYLCAEKPIVATKNDGVQEVLVDPGGQKKRLFR